MVTKIVRFQNKFGFKSITHMYLFFGFSRVPTTHTTTTPGTIFQLPLPLPLPPSHISYGLVVCILKQKVPRRSFRNRPTCFQSDSVRPLSLSGRHCRARVLSHAIVLIFFFGLEREGWGVRHPLPPPYPISHIPYLISTEGQFSVPKTFLSYSRHICHPVIPLSFQSRP